MKLHAIIPSVVLVAAMSFSGGAFAQNMYNGLAIPSDQIENFKGKCEALRAAGTASLATSNDVENETVDETATGSIGTDVDARNAADSDPAARDNWEAAIATLSVEDCDAAGFAAQ